MARIRTVKPALFRHIDLFEAEQKSGLPLRLAFIGLWTVADREGRFRWQPRAIKLDVLPYDVTDFAAVMDALAEHGFVIRYSVDGHEYGAIPSFRLHQHVNVKEPKSEIPAHDGHRPRTVKAPDKNGGGTIRSPAADSGNTGKSPVSADESVVGKGKGKGRGKGKEIVSSLRSETPPTASPPAGHREERAAPELTVNGKRADAFDLSYFSERSDDVLTERALTEEEARELNAKVGAPPPATGAPELTIEPVDGKPKRRPRAKAKLSGELDAAFEAFWVKYPRHENKADARRAYVRAADKATVEALDAGLDDLLAHPPSDPKYWPYASTWLNGERWTNDYRALKPVPRTKSSDELMVESLGRIVAEKSGAARGDRPDDTGPPAEPGGAREAD